MEEDIERLEEEVNELTNERNELLERVALLEKTLDDNSALIKDAFDDMLSVL